MRPVHLPVVLQDQINVFGGRRRTRTYQPAFADYGLAIRRITTLPAYRRFGGSGGIRTHVPTHHRPSVFKTGALNLSATLPKRNALNALLC